MRVNGAGNRFRRRLLLAVGACALLAAGLACSSGPQPEPAPDCPAALHCTFSPAAYASDGGSYGNYDTASRPAGGLKIDSIVIHDTEATYSSAISAFDDPSHQAASNYVVQSSTGDITETVRPRDVAWATGNWYYNTHSISIENEGFGAQGARWFTRAEYRSDAALVRYLARRYGVPLDREHIVGHDMVGGESDADDKTQHTDPGPYWNWDYFMALVRGESEPAYLARQGSAGVDGHHVAVITPDWAGNKPPVAGQPPQPANFVYLRTRPSPTAPLLSDPTLHPGGGPGTTKIIDWSATAQAGEAYVLAGRRGGWTGIWFAGQVGWFYNPNGPAATARFTGAWVITPKPGHATVPVYGAAYPPVSAYPKGVSPRPDPPLAYRIRAGQSYVTTGPVPDDDYNASYSNVPDNHEVIRGRTSYDEILLNHRLFYVPAADVVLRHLG